MAAYDYTAPAYTTPNGYLVVNLGKVETTTTGTASPVATHSPPTTVDSGRPDLATDIELGDVVAAYGATYYGQRASVSSRGPARLIGGRPQAPASHGMYTSSQMLVGLDAITLELQDTALAEDLGSDNRWVADPTKLMPSVLIAPQAWQTSVPASGALPIFLTQLDGAALATVDGGYYYTSRIGDIVRPALYEDSTFVHCDPSGTLAPLTSGSYPTFTFSLVAMLHETSWSFNDIIGAYAGNLAPAVATVCTLRFQRDDLELYIAKRRIATFKVNKYASSPGPDEKTQNARPTIIVWSCDHTGTTSLVVYTPHTNLTQTYRFPAVPVFRGPFTISGSPITGAAPDTSQFNSGYYGAMGQMEILDIGFWSDAISLEDCEAAARVLDQIYGVKR